LVLMLFSRGILRFLFRLVRFLVEVLWGLFSGSAIRHVPRIHA